MKNINIILLNAKAGEGKDSYYQDYLKEFGELEYIERFAFADAIKELMVKFFNWDGINKEGIWRTRLQKIGSYFRELDKNVWIDFIKKDIDEYINFYNEVGIKDVTVIITDTRFDNEIIRMKELFPNYNVIVKRLHREFESCLNDAQQNDISERGISDDLVDEEIYLENRKDGVSSG